MEREELQKIVQDFCDALAKFTEAFNTLVADVQKTVPEEPLPILWMMKINADQTKDYPFTTFGEYMCTAKGEYDGRDLGCDMVVNHSGDIHAMRVGDVLQWSTMDWTVAKPPSAMSSDRTDPWMIVVDIPGKFGFEPWAGDAGPICGHTIGGINEENGQKGWLRICGLRYGHDTRSDWTGWHRQNIEGDSRTAEQTISWRKR